MPEPYWCESAPNVQRVWSSSSLSTIAECPRKYELKYVEGWESKEDNLDFDFGIKWHRLMESYWRGRFAGQDHEELLRDLVGVALGYSLPAPTRPNQAGKTVQGLARSLVWYFEQYPTDEKDQIVLLDGEPGIELNFRFVVPLGNPDGEMYIIQGYLDNLRNFNEMRTVWDYKTTGGSITDFYLNRFNIDIQNHIYTIAAQSLSLETFTYFMADVIGVGVSYTDFRRHIIRVSPGELDEATQDIMHWIRAAERYAEYNYWPKNTKACNFCQFNGICDKDPAQRISFLTSDFDEKRTQYVIEREENADTSKASAGESPASPGPGRPRDGEDGITCSAD